MTTDPTAATRERGITLGTTSPVRPAPSLITEPATPAAAPPLCASEYAEAPGRDRRCVQTADHVAASPLHYNRAGFAWSDEEARESAQRVAAAAAGQTDELPDEWLLALIRQVNAEEGLDLADDELLHHGRTDGYIRLARSMYQLGRAEALGYEVTMNDEGDRVLVGDRQTETPADQATRIIKETADGLRRTLTPGIQAEALIGLVSDAIAKAFGCTCRRHSDAGAVYTEDALCPLHEPETRGLWEAAVAAGLGARPADASQADAECAVVAALTEAWQHFADDPVYAEQVAAVAVAAARPSIEQRAADRIIAHADRHTPDRTSTGRRWLLTAARIAAGPITPEQVVEALARGDYIACQLDDAGRPVRPDVGQGSGR